MYPADFFGRNVLSCLFSAPPQFAEQELALKEREYLNQLLNIPLDYTGDAERARLGQEIFNFFKKASGGHTFAGKDALTRIAASLPDDDNGISHKRQVSKAWCWVGDNFWRWQ